MTMEGFGRRKKRSFIGPFAFIALIVIIVWAAGFFAFLKLVPDQISDALSNTDGIVVLTGGTERLNTGINLLGEQKASKL